jgi:hypothetical protein
MEDSNLAKRTGVADYRRHRGIYGNGSFLQRNGWILLPALTFLSYLPARMALYALVEGLALHATVVAITNGHEAVFAEDGPIEWVHFGLMLGASALFFYQSRMNSAYPAALLLCGLLALVAALRELDRYSEVLLFEDAYKYPVAVIAFFALYVFWQNRSTLGPELTAFSQESAFFFLAFGSFLTAIVAQILGQAELWHALIEGPSARTVKRVLEESLETMGYVILFLGALEIRVRRTLATAGGWIAAPTSR